MKAEQEAINLRDFINAHDGVDGTADDIVKQIAQRSVYGLPSLEDPAQFRLNKQTKFMIDREIYGERASLDPDLKIALFRFFLEPSHESVDTWSLSLNGTEFSRAGTYNLCRRV